MSLHRFGDLIVESEIPLSALPQALEGSPDCSLRLGVPPPERERRWDHHWRRANGTISLSCARDSAVYHLGFPDLAQAIVEEGGRRVTLSPADDLPADTAEHIVIDQILPRIAGFQGRLVLHAGCVAIGQGACAFLGDSGAGKSTLCGAFAKAGIPIIGDDGILARRLATGGTAVEATYPGLRLAPRPFAHLWGDPASAARVAHNSDKRRVPLNDAELVRFDRGPLPLLAIYVLARSRGADDDAGVDVEPLKSRDAFLALLRATFQLHLSDASRSRRLFDAVSQTLDAVPVKRLRYPGRLDRLPDVVGAVLRDLCGGS